MPRATSADYRGEMTHRKAARLIAGMTTADVILGITGPQSLIRDHTINQYGPLPSAIVLDVLAERIRAEKGN